MSTSPGVAPFGSWPSPITPGALAAGSVRITTLVADGADLWWSETRPSAKGRTALVRRRADGSVREMTPPEANVRTRVHSYGGAAWWVHNGVLVYSDDADGRLRRLGPGDTEPVLLTPAGPYCYADGRITADGRWFVCVRERPSRSENVNEVICVATDGSGRVEVVVSGADFYSDPRPSPSGDRLLWLQWDHPNMPWDGCELHVGTPRWRRWLPNPVASPGGSTSGSSVLRGIDDGALSWVSDGAGWSTLWVLEGDPLAAGASPRIWVDLRDGEVQTAPWVFGMSSPRCLVGSLRRWPCTLAYAVTRRGGHELRLIGGRPRGTADVDSVSTAAGAGPCAAGRRVCFNPYRVDLPGAHLVQRLARLARGVWSPWPARRRWRTTSCTSPSTGGDAGGPGRALPDGTCASIAAFRARARACDVLHDRRRRCPWVALPPRQPSAALPPTGQGRRRCS